MQNKDKQLSRLLDFIVEHLDVPKSYYEKAAARHRSLGEWLHRDESRVAPFDPDVRPQGSFRYGTVIKPIDPDAEYDLDNVCLLRLLKKSMMTQRAVKELYGSEIKAYAKAHGMLSLPTEHNRCWRLRYADEVNFHLDTLPCVPEDSAIIQQLIQLGVRPDLAERAVAITDRRDPRYEEISALWPCSNPRGFAAWFEERAALGFAPITSSKGFRAAIENVPPYEWKTTLQRSIQILKRHRDVMFRKNPDLGPISMIITNLAAQAYRGERDLLDALRNIVEAMPDYVRPTKPRVPNPAHPAEDYAEKWAANPQLEKSFWEWHAAVRTDLQRLDSLIGTSRLRVEVTTTFMVELTDDQSEVFQQEVRVEVRSAAPTIVVPSAAKPWGRDD